MLKRISAVLLAVAMMLTMACTISVAYAEENIATLVATPDKATVKRGETVTFTVSIETTDVDLTGLAIDMDYDAAVLAYGSKAAVKTDEMPYAAADTAFVWATGDGKLDFDGALCTYTFTVKEDADLGEADVFEVEAIEACYDTATDSEDAPELVGVGAAAITVECAHSYEGAEWQQPAADTAKEDAKHYQECIFDDCEETKEEACSFVQTGVTKHTEQNPGAIHWECTVCGYTCDTEIPAGHDLITRYKAATADKDGCWEEYCTICEEAIETTLIPAGHPGTDVTNPSAWYYDAVNYANAAGLMTGSNGQAKPMANITRIEVMAVLARIYYGGDANVPAYNEADNIFADINGNYWGAKYAQACQKAGLMGGTVIGGKTYANPTNKITTQEVVVFMGRLYKAIYGEAEISFGPVANVTDMNKVASWALPEVQWAVSTGFVAGNAQGQINPTGLQFRSQMATLLMRYDMATRGVVTVTE